MLAHNKVLKEDGNKWNRFGSLGDLVDEPLENGGYKEIFKKERLTGKILIGKQRKTLADLMKRIGVRNVKHRDLLVESIYDLSKPIVPLTEQQMMEERIVLVLNSWTEERRPDIQLHALADIMRASADSSRHQLLADLEITKLLRNILDSAMMDPMLEEDLKGRQLEIDALWEKRKARMLTYVEKKDLDRKAHLQARDWVQWKADFGSLAVVAFGTLQNLSGGALFQELLVSEGFGGVLASQLQRIREAEAHLAVLRVGNRGQFMSLVSSEVQEQQLILLHTVYNLATLPRNRRPLVQHGLARAAVQVAHSAKDGQRLLQCMRILCLLSLAGGETEEQVVADGALAVVVRSLREGAGDTLLFAVTTLCNLAFIPANRHAIVAAGALPPLNLVLKRGDEVQQLKAIDAIRNIAAAGADLKLARTVVSELAAIVTEGAGEHRLRALIALRSISRAEETMTELVDRGVLQLVVDIAQEREDPRLCAQALGLLFNVVGFTAQPPLDDDSDDDLSDEHPDEGDASDEGTGEPESRDEDGGEERSRDEEGSAGEEPEVSSGTVRRARRLLLKRVSPFFKMLSARELEQLAVHCPYRRVAKNEVVSAQGELSDTLYAVVEGRLRVLVAVGTASHKTRKTPPPPAGLTTPSVSGSDTEASPVQGSPVTPMATPLGGGKGGPTALRERPSTRKLIFSPLRQGKEMKEVARLRAGETACELCVLEGRAGAATVVAMESALLLEIRAQHLLPILLRRPDLAHALKPADRLSLSAAAQLHRVWADPTMSDEAAEQQALFSIEKSERRTKTHTRLLQLGALGVLESFIGAEGGRANRTLAKAGLALLIGGIEHKESAVLEVDEEVIRSLCDCIDAAAVDEDWHGHRYRIETLLLATRLLAVNDKNKRRFVQHLMIPFVLSLFRLPRPSVMRLATHILLDLSFGMRARWLLRPVLSVWHKFVRNERKDQQRIARAPPSNDTVDFAAPTHVVNVRAPDFEPAFELELHEAASEGGLRWLQRLVEEEGVEATVRDGHGASAMHYAAMNGHVEVMDYLVELGADINAEDQAGCTPLAWMRMARNIEFGTASERWPKEWRRAMEWMTNRDAVAKFLPMFPSTV